LRGLHLDVVAQLCDFNPSLQSLWTLIFLTHAGVFPHLFYIMSPFHLLLPRFRSLLPDRVNPPAFSLSLIDIYRLTANCRCCIFVLCLPLSPYHLYRFLYPLLVPSHPHTYLHIISPSTLIAYCLLTPSTHLHSSMLCYVLHPTESRSLPPIIQSHPLSLSLSIATTTTPFLYKFAFHFFSVPSYLVPSPNSLYTLYFLHIQGGKKKKENYIFED
jgi:hypothetical protein